MYLEPKTKMSKETITNTKEIINKLKEEKEYYITQIMTVENLGYNFQEITSYPDSNDNSNISNELYDIMEIEQKCKELKTMINKLYSDKIKSVNLKLENN